MSLRSRAEPRAPRMQWSQCLLCGSRVPIAFEGEQPARLFHAAGCPGERGQ
jgi:hypothetical protein